MGTSLQAASGCREETEELGEEGRGQVVQDAHGDTGPTRGWGCHETYKMLVHVT